MDANCSWHRGWINNAIMQVGLQLQWKREGNSSSSRSGTEVSINNAVFCNCHCVLCCAVWEKVSLSGLGNAANSTHYLGKKCRYSASHFCCCWIISRKSTQCSSQCESECSWLGLAHICRDKSSEGKSIIVSFCAVQSFSLHLLPLLPPPLLPTSPVNQLRMKWNEIKKKSSIERCCCCRRPLGSLIKSTVVSGPKWTVLFRHVHFILPGSFPNLTNYNWNCPSAKTNSEVAKEKKMQKSKFNSKRFLNKKSSNHF